MWVSKGHTTPECWVDTTVGTNEQAFLFSLSARLKDPTGSGRCLIILHIGCKNAFSEGVHLFLNQKVLEIATKKSVAIRKLQKLDPGCITVKDSAPYNSI
jgi:hypothetical protein